jgi:23S rRNA-/tRNA-specific pseudouridylate synthase
MKLMHRIDKSVSGLLMIGKDDNFTRKFGEDLKANRIEKIYISIVQGIPNYLKNFNGKYFSIINRGIIKSNEECNKFTVEFENGLSINQDKIVNLNDYKNEATLLGKFNILKIINYDKVMKTFIPKEIKDITDITKYDDTECYSLILYELITGKKHQIRKHFSKCFFTPIVNDEYYSFDKNKCTITYDKIISNKIHSSNLIDRKLQINDPKASIFLHSVQLKLPYIIDQYSCEHVIAFQENNTILIKDIRLPQHFLRLYKLLNINHDNYDKFYKI